MATSVAIAAPLFLDGIELSARAARMGMGLFTATHGVSTEGNVRSGVKYLKGDSLRVAAAGGMDVAALPGSAIIQNTVAASRGAYIVTSYSNAVLTLTPSDATYDRYDAIIARVVDTGNAYSTTTIEIVTGTPSASPAYPTLPTNSLLLAYVIVEAGVTSVDYTKITDMRSFTVAHGGILPVSAYGTPSVVVKGTFIYDYTNQQLMVTDDTKYHHVKNTVTCTSSTRPTSAVIAGTVIHETDTKNNYLFDGTNWVPLKYATTCTSSTRPSNPIAGNVILETDTSNLMVYSSSQWRPLSKKHVCTSSTRPANPQTGSALYETDTKATKLYDGSNWKTDVSHDYFTYVPAWTAAGTAPDIGNGTITGKYIVFGKLIHVYISVTFGTTTTYGTNEWRFSLPSGFTPNVSTTTSVRYGDSGTGVLVPTAHTVSGVSYLTLRFKPNTSDYSSYVSGIFPITAAANDYLFMDCHYAWA